MVNPFDYLYYKIYTAISYISGGGYSANHHSVMGALLLLNITTIYILIAGTFSLPFAIVCIGVETILFFIFYMPKRGTRILAKYNKESEKSRMIGNAAVVLYVIITIVTFALVLKAHL